MELSGQWDPDADRIIDHLAKIEQVFLAGANELPSGPVREASSTMYKNISAVSGTILKICRDTTTPCSSQVVGSLLRTVIESAISIFALCHDPPKRAITYLQFRVVLEWKNQRAAAANLGCPILSALDTREFEIALQMAERDLWLRGGAQILKPYMEKRIPENQRQQYLQTAVTNGEVDPKWFRTHWWPEERLSDVLVYEQMAWVYGVLYQWLCSCVHSDACAGKPLAGLKRNTAAMLALQFWGSSVLRLSQALGVDIGADNARFLEHNLYKRLQWVPAGSPPETKPQSGVAE
jgi:hypothetical protein